MLQHLALPVSEPGMSSAFIQEVGLQMHPLFLEKAAWIMKYGDGSTLLSVLSSQLFVQVFFLFQTFYLVQNGL